MDYLESTMETLVLVIWFAGNDLAPTTNKHCDFNATLTCSVMGENATCNVQK